MNVFFATASPYTLASLMVDIDLAECGDDISSAQNSLRRDCWYHLIAIIGKQEAEKLIQELTQTADLATRG